MPGFSQAKTLHDGSLINPDKKADHLQVHATDFHIARIRLKLSVGLLQSPP